MNKYVFLLILIALFNCKISRPQKGDYKELRTKMVEEQIKDRGITDNQVIDAMLKVERHLFVPPDQVQFAYRDCPLPIGYNQTISQPYIVAFMTQVLNLKKTTRVLEIGTGSGYQAAILGEICDSVFSVEIVPELEKRASDLLSSLDYKNIKLKSGDGYKGWPEESPFDAIIVTCAPSRIPEALKDQLGEGGRMIIPVGDSGSVQELVLLTKRNNELTEKSVLPVRFVPMVDEKKRNY